MSRVLVSGSGIAGLTFACCLAPLGWSVKIVEKAPQQRMEGYMVAFFGNGWKVADRLNLLDDILKIRYPIDDFGYVNEKGEKYFSVPIKRIRKGFGGNYTYLRRPDLEEVLLEKAQELSVPIQYGTTISGIRDLDGGGLGVKFQNGEEEAFDFVVGADGVHSGVRRLAFGEERDFAYYLGYAVAAFQATLYEQVDRGVQVYQEPGRCAIFYPISDRIMDCIFMFRHPAHERVSKADFRKTLLEKYRGSRWILSDVLEGTVNEQIIFLDPLEQIRMQSWSKGRVCLIGDACACLTLIAGQGASMAMLEAYTLARELDRDSDFEAAFHRYESLLKSDVRKRQGQAARVAGNFAPSSDLSITLRRWIVQADFSRLLIHRTAESFKGKIFSLDSS